MGLVITIATEQGGWFEPHARHMAENWRRGQHQVRVVYKATDIPQGDIAFLLSFGQLVPADIRARHDHNVVVHASALPAGKGWSPWVWQVLEGASTIPLTLFEAVDRVDAGPIYLQGAIELTGFELLDELRAALATGIRDMCDRFVDSYPDVVRTARHQSREGESFYPRRTPDDSRLDPDLTLREQFNLLRVVDPDRYPAFFDLDGHRYTLVIKRIGPVG